jgi:hypothetical protein
MNKKNEMDNLPQKVSDIPNLTFEENALIVAKSATKFIDLSSNLKAAKAMDLITDAIDRCGTKQADGGITQRAIKDLANAFESNLQHSTPEEIELALVTGQQNHPDQFSISSRVIFQWIKEFREVKKLELNKSIEIKRKNLPDPLAEEPTPEESLATVEVQFQIYLKLGVAQVFTYNNLEMLGVEFTDEEKFDQMRKAKPRLIQETRESARPLIMFQIKARIKELEESPTPEEYKKDPKKKPVAAIIAESKRQLVIKFFNLCMEECCTPKDMIENLKTQQDEK